MVKGQGFVWEGERGALGWRREVEEGETEVGAVEKLEAGGAGCHPGSSWPVTPDSEQLELP